jgi:hypothetical protein
VSNQPAERHCDQPTTPHPAHKFMLGRSVYQCPGKDNTVKQQGSGSIPPTGPAITYTFLDITGLTTVASVDRSALTDPRERAICKALLWRALRLIEDADRADAGDQP